MHSSGELLLTVILRTISMVRDQTTQHSLYALSQQRANDHSFIHSIHEVIQQKFREPTLWQVLIEALEI